MANEGSGEGEGQVGMMWRLVLALGTTALALLSEPAIARKAENVLDAVCTGTAYLPPTTELNRNTDGYEASRHLHIDYGANRVWLDGWMGPPVLAKATINEVLVFGSLEYTFEEPTAGSSRTVRVEETFGFDRFKHTLSVTYQALDGYEPNPRRMAFTGTCARSDQW